MSQILGVDPLLVHGNGSDCTLGTNLLTRMAIVQHRGKPKIRHLLDNNLLDNTPPETHTTYVPTLPLPYEIAEVITAHLTRDLPLSRRVR